MRSPRHAWPARLTAVTAATGAVLLTTTTAAWGCGGLVSPNGAVELSRATTLAAYVGGVEHYVTGFAFEGTAKQFGAIVPLPGVPTEVKRAGSWTLQRLVREVNPPTFDSTGARTTAASSGGASVLLQTHVDALELTVLSGGGRDVVDWVRAHGFQVSADAPAMLDFYAKRSPVFLAARFDPSQARNRGLRAGDSTPVQIAIPTPNPWVPLHILTLAKKANEPIDADVFLLTPRRPALLSGTGIALKRSEPASGQLLSDLHRDKGMEWMPTSSLWFSYLRLAAQTKDLTYDLAIDTSRDAHPSTTGAALTTGTSVGPAYELPRPERGRWIALGAVIAAVVCGVFAMVLSTVRRMPPPAASAH